MPIWFSRIGKSYKYDCNLQPGWTVNLISFFIVFHAWVPISQTAFSDFAGILNSSFAFPSSSHVWGCIATSWCPVHRPSSFPQQFLCRWNLGRSIYGEIGNSETERRRAQSPPFLPPASSLCPSFNHPRNRRFFSQFFPSLNLEGPLHIFMNSLNSLKDLDWKTKSRKTHRLFLFSSRWHSSPEA